MRIHNRYLPQWTHRIANGVMEALLLALFAVSGAQFVPAGSPLWKAAILLLWLSAPVGLLVSLLDPRKFSLVEGVAGDVGYDELEWLGRGHCPPSGQKAVGGDDR
jgi:hypothetical protein